jgi:hypothetical protein
VLAASDANALDSWLRANGFVLPEDKGGVVREYIDRHWYFVAVRIDLTQLQGFELASSPSKSAAANQQVLQEKLAQGELHPLLIRFESPRCVFPLKISSLNASPSEVQVYVLSPQPLIEKAMFRKKLSEHRQWRLDHEVRRRETLEHLRSRSAGMNPGDAGPAVSRRPPLMEPDSRLDLASYVDDEALLPYGLVTKRELPACSRQMPALRKGDWWLTRQTWKFQPREMQDLVFDPAVPVLASQLPDEEGYFVAANLVRLGTKAAPALLAALQSTNPAVRVHAASVMEQMFEQPSAPGKGTPSEDDTTPEPDEYSRLQFQPAYRPVVGLLPAMFKDAEPGVRRYAAFAALNAWNPAYLAPILALLQDSSEEVCFAAAACLNQRQAECRRHSELLLHLLQEGSPQVQAAVIRVLAPLNAAVSREELLKLFKVPRMDVAGFAFRQLRESGISDEEALPLLQNSAFGPRLMGLAVLRRNGTAQSVEFALPLLQDSEPMVQARACRLLQDLTGQAFPADQPGQWTQWWNDNRATFTPKPVPQSPAGRRSLRRPGDAAGGLESRPAPVLPPGGVPPPTP